MSRIRFALLLVLTLPFAAVPASSQPLLKAPYKSIREHQADRPDFGYWLTYNCSNTSGPCLNAEVDDLLPAVVQEISTVPASPTATWRRST